MEMLLYQSTQFRDVKKILDRAHGFAGLLTAGGIEASRLDMPFVCDQKVLSRYDDACGDVRRILAMQLGLELPKGFSIPLEAEDLAVFFSQQCSLRQMQDYLAQKRRQTQADIAVWLRERGVYTGKSIGGHLCFSPQEPVGRGEFLVMAMRLLGAEPDDAALTSGFADETATPVWMRPYIVAALRSGAVSGAAAENGVIFRPADALTHAEAAVMVQGLLALPVAESRSVFSEEGADALPVWARGAAGALETAGIALDMSEPDAPLTRLEAASTLRQAYLLQNSSGQ